jgi:hypothetical protein
VIASIPGVLVMFVIWALLPTGAARLAVGLGVGLTLCASVGLAQLGRGRIVEALRALRRPRRVKTDEVVEELPGETAT